MVEHRSIDGVGLYNDSTGRRAWCLIVLYRSIDGVGFLYDVSYLSELTDLLVA